MDPHPGGDSRVSGSSTPPRLPGQGTPNGHRPWAGPVFPRFHSSPRTRKSPHSGSESLGRSPGLVLPSPCPQDPVLSGSSFISPGACEAAGWDSGTKSPVEGEPCSRSSPPGTGGMGVSFPTCACGPRAAFSWQCIWPCLHSPFFRKWAAAALGALWPGTQTCALSQASGRSRLPRFRLCVSGKLSHSGGTLHVPRSVTLSCHGRGH